MGKGFELILVTGLADFAADVVCGAVACRFSLSGFDGLRGAARGEPRERSSQRTANEQRLDDSVWTQPSALAFEVTILLNQA